MIEVILLERIERLGQMGQVVKVRPGFARNFLLPHSKALRATKANLELFEKQRAELEAKNASERAKAETLAKNLENVSLVIVRQASETGHLYGSVTGRDIADAAKEAGHTIERSQVHVDAPIKSIGIYQVRVKLHPEVSVNIGVNIARSQDEASAQAKKGAAEAKAEAEKEAVIAAFVEAPKAAEGEEPVAAPKKAAKKAKAAASDDAEEAPASKAKSAKGKKAAKA